MTFWLKVLHLSSVALWFAGLVFLPQLLRARQVHGSRDVSNRLDASMMRLYVRIMTPAALCAVVLGALLLASGPRGGDWLVAKLVLVSLAVLLHLRLGLAVFEAGRPRRGLGPWALRLAGCVPAVLLLAIAALSAAKPRTLLQDPDGHAARGHPRGDAASSPVRPGGALP